MPKLKTNSGAAKRFRVTKRGKVLAKRAKLRHILTTKSKKVKRHMRKVAVVDRTNLGRLRVLMPYS
jgi:large subunit ribosomal protein L35